VQVSSHGTVCEICAQYEGKVYSISGKTLGYPILDARTPFHPNCEHSLLPTSPEAILAGEGKLPSVAVKPISLKVPKYEEWRPAKSIKEAETWAKKNIADQVDYSQLDLDVANLWNKELDVLRAKGFRLEAIGTNQDIAKMIGVPTHQSAMSVWHQGGEGFRWNYLSYDPRWTNSLATLKVTNGGLHVTGMIKFQDAAGMIRHELAHILEWQSYTSKTGLASEVLQRRFANAYSSAVLKAKASNQLKAKIGSYMFRPGPNQAKEFLAECYRIYKTGTWPKEMQFAVDYFKSLGW